MRASGRDEHLGRVGFDLSEVPRRAARQHAGAAVVRHGGQQWRAGADPDAGVLHGCHLSLVSASNSMVDAMIQTPAVFSLFAVHA